MKRSCRVPVLIGFTACLLPWLNEATAEEQPPAKDQPAVKEPATEYRRPFLVALSWQHADRAKADDVQPAWRPDGKQIDADEAHWLHKEVRRFDSQRYVPGFLQRPLILIFQVDELTKSPQRLKVAVIADGKRFDQSASGDSGRTFLSKSAVMPTISQLAAWPKEVDVEVRVPVAEPELVKRIETLPHDPIRLDRGVKWYVDPAGGAEFRSRGLEEQMPGPAFIFQIDRAEADPQVEYTYQFRLKDRDFQMRGFSVRSPDGKEIDVQQIVSKDTSIQWVEFYRQRYRIERYEKVRLRTDLMVE